MLRRLLIGAAAITLGSLSVVGATQPKQTSTNAPSSNYSDMRCTVVDWQNGGKLLVSILCLPEYSPVRYCYRLTTARESQVQFDNVFAVPGELTRVRFHDGGAISVRLRSRTNPNLQRWKSFSTVITRFHLSSDSRQWPTMSPVADLICKGATSKSILEWEMATLGENRAQKVNGHE